MSYNDNYYDDGRGAGEALAFLIVFYPFIPFTVVGYELLDALSGGINGAKWGGAVLGGIIGWYFYINVGKFLVQKMNIHYLLTVLLGYSFASGLFWALGSIYPDNRMVVMALDAGKWIGAWATTAS
jgi:hypothetical protein